MIRRKGKILRGLIVISSAAGSIADVVGGLWRSPAGRGWLIPLVVFLCVTGLVLVVAATVEGLAPFIYTIF
jgi:Family of unknown function (DUF5989)